MIYRVQARKRMGAIGVFVETEQAAIEKVREYQEDSFDGIEVLDDLGKPISIDGFPANVKTPR
jgi:hypothetical protein